MAAGAPDIGALLAHLQGAGIGPPPAGIGGPGLPAGLHGGPGLPPPPGMAAPPGAAGPQAHDEGPAVGILKQMIQLAQRYLQVEPDHEDKATMTKVLSTLQTYMAKDQQDMQQAMGGNPSVARVLRKTPSYGA